MYMYLVKNETKNLDHSELIHGTQVALLHFPLVPSPPLPWFLLCLCGRGKMKLGTT